jgi:hypothetical protein
MTFADSLKAMEEKKAKQAKAAGGVHALGPAGGLPGAGLPRATNASAAPKGPPKPWERKASGGASAAAPRTSFASPPPTTAAAATAAAAAAAYGGVASPVAAMTQQPAVPAYHNPSLAALNPVAPAYNPDALPITTPQPGVQYNPQMFATQPSAPPYNPYAAAPGGTPVVQYQNAQNTAPSPRFEIIEETQNGGDMGE